MINKYKFTLGDRVYYFYFENLILRFRSFIIGRRGKNGENFYYAMHKSKYPDLNCFYSENQLFLSLDDLKTHLHAQVDALKEQTE